MRRTLVLAFLFILPSLALRAQDVLTVGTETASAGSVVSIPVSILDRSGTPLGVDAGSGNRIQGFAFKILFPTELVTSVAFSRAGVAATITPLYQSPLQGTGWSACIVSFRESSDPIAFNLNTTAPGDRIGTLAVTLRGDAPAGSIASLILDPPSAMLSNQAGTARETVSAGTLSLKNGSVTVSTVQSPSALVATASGTTQVNLTWTAVAGADFYEVFRSSGAGAFALIGTAPGNTFADTPVSANTTYLYRVRASNSGNLSGFSNVDAATTIVFTDDPLVAQSTKIKAVHLTQLRTAVNAMRAAAGLTALAADPTVAVGLVVRAQHITDLRTALNAARSAIGLTTLTYTDTPPIVIKAVHVQELRNGVK